MSFRKNISQQITFEDILYGLTARERKALNGSWAKYFADEIFPYIDEEPFRVLYSEKGSRPNTPVNVCVAALIIKELQGVSDEEMAPNLMLDQRYQLAMYTTSCAEQPLSDKTLQRFRNRCAKYLEETGIDLIHDCITALADRIREALGLSGRLRRMDSLMIAANIKRLNRMQLLYTCVRNLVKRDEKLGLEIPEQRQHYLNSSDYNRVFYYANSDENAGELERILEDAADLLACTAAEHQESNEYVMLKRCMEEQTTTDEESGELRLRTKEDGGMHSGILQNPSDPDATYREKAGKSHRGYVANVEETAGENGSVVMDYQVEANNYSDNQFLPDSLERMETPADPADPQETVTLVTDGAYAGPENQGLAERRMSI